MNYLSRSRTPPAISALPTAARRLAGNAITALLPQACALCGAWAGRWPVCATCDAGLPRPPDKHCPHCGDTSEAGDVCARCLATPCQFDATIAAFAYGPPIDGMIQSLKYAHRLHLADWFGQRLAARWARSGEIPDPAVVIVPLPLHPGRLAERGFNQATEIARPLARRLKTSIDHALCVRVRATAPQAQLALADRRANVRDAFECRGSLVGRTVVLVDDVMTSGASLGELARTVRLHGASRVVAAVAARTLHG